MGGGGGGCESAVSQIHVLVVILFERLLKTNNLKSKWTKNAAHWESVYGVFVCACVYVLDGEGTRVYSSVSTALVVVNTDSFVSDRLQWLCDQFLWPIFATL